MIGEASSNRMGVEEYMNGIELMSYAARGGSCEKPADCGKVFANF